MTSLVVPFGIRQRPVAPARRPPEPPTPFVSQTLEDTYFLWMGGIDDDSVFYYRVHSPVLLVEFDHLRGIALDNDEPARTHIHTVVRTPNGNDYGRDLLRQHYARFHQPPK